MDVHVKKNGFLSKNEYIGDFEVAFIRSPRAPKNAEFLPARVVHRTTNEEVWNFKRHRRAMKNFTGLSLLRDFDGEPVIILATKETLYAVLPLADLPYMEQVGAEFIGGRNVWRLLYMKSALGRMLSLNVAWTEQEMILQGVACTVEQKNVSPSLSARTAKPARSKLQKPPQFRTLMIAGKPTEVLVVDSILEVNTLGRKGVGKNVYVMCPKPNLYNEQQFTIFRFDGTRFVRVKDIVRQSNKK